MLLTDYKDSHYFYKQIAPNISTLVKSFIQNHTGSKGVLMV